MYTRAKRTCWLQTNPRTHALQAAWIRREPLGPDDDTYHVSVPKKDHIIGLYYLELEGKYIVCDWDAFKHKPGKRSMAETIAWDEFNKMQKVSFRVNQEHSMSKQKRNW